ncbi:hypothetical protein AAY473_020180, partial [Plecturocebus cupreus]
MGVHEINMETVSTVASNSRESGRQGRAEKLPTGYSGHYLGDGYTRSQNSTIAQCIQIVPALKYRTPSSYVFGLFDLHQGFRAFDHRLKAAQSSSLLWRFWDSDWLPGSSACRRPTVGLHLPGSVKIADTIQPADRENLMQETDYAGDLRTEKPDIMKQLTALSATRIKAERRTWTRHAASSGLRLSPMLDASCSQTSDSKFFSFWALGLTPVVCQGLSGLWERTEGCTVDFPSFEGLGLRLAPWLLSLQTTYCGTSPCDRSLALLPWVACSGAISAHYNLCLLGSNAPRKALSMSFQHSCLLITWCLFHVVLCGQRGFLPLGPMPLLDLSLQSLSFLLTLCCHSYSRRMDRMLTRSPGGVDAALPLRGFVERERKGCHLKFEKHSLKPLRAAPNKVQTPRKTKPGLYFPNCSFFFSHPFILVPP